MRSAFLLGLFGASLACRATASPQPAPPSPPSAVAARAVADAGPLDAAIGAPPTAAPRPAARPACEQARAALEAALAPALDRCVTHARQLFGPIVIDLDVDAAGLVHDVRWAASTSTAWGPRVARCILASTRAAPFAEPACAGTTIHVVRAYGRGQRADGAR